MVSGSMWAGTYEYSSIPAMNTYTNTGSGTTEGPALDYSNEYFAGGLTNYTNGQLKATLLSVGSSGTLNFRIAKVSGYFVNGNKGKIFIIDGSLNIYVKSFTISNSSTSYINMSVDNSNFTGTRTYRIYLITSDLVYKQYGGLISVTGSLGIMPPTVETDEATNITSSSARLNGVVSPNGSTTTYYFRYGPTTSMTQTTSTRTLSASAGATSVSATISGLSSNTYYYSQLVAENDGGFNTGGWATFTTESAYNNPPVPPSNPSPSQASSNVATSGTLSWSCSDPEGDPITYKVYLGTSPSNMSLYKTTSYKYCSYSLSTATTYLWYVVADDGNQSSTGPTWNFTTKSYLEAPTNPSPANYATDVPTSGTLSWSCNNSGSNIQYNVYLGSSSIGLVKIGTTSSKSYSYSSLDKGSTYFWRVVATDGNEEAQSPMWQFNTIATPSGGCSFSDLPQTNDYYESTCYLSNLGVLYGVINNGVTQANNNIKRADLAKIAFQGVYSIKDRIVPDEVPSDFFPTVYSDLTDNSADYSQAARALLYLEYDDGIAPFDRDRLAFQPDSTISRINTLKVLMETFNIQPDIEGTNNPFPSDQAVVALANSNPIKMGYIRRAASLGIITTANQYFNPNNKCLRGEAFVMLAHIMQKVDNGIIDDPDPGTDDYFEPLNVTLKTISLGLDLPLGNFNHYAKTSFSLDGTVPLEFSHIYNSYNTTLPDVFYGVRNVNGLDETYQPLGEGWSHNYHSYIAVIGNPTSSDARAIVHWGGGKIDVYKSNGSKMVPESLGVYDDFTLEGNEVVITTKSQVKYRFTPLGASIFCLTKVTDRNGNTLTVEYETGATSFKRIKRITDGNRSLSFYYSISGTDLLTKVSDPLGRSIQFGYTYNNLTGRRQLSSFTDAKGQTTNYTYGNTSKVSTSKLLTSIQLPKGNYIENDYDANNLRLHKTMSGKGSIPTTQTTVNVTTNYNSSGNIITYSTVDVDHGSGPSASYHYTFNSNNIVTSMTGSEDLYVYNTYGNPNHPQLPTKIQSNSADVSNVTYDDKGNVTRVTITGDGTLTTSMTYNSTNDLTSVTDPNGHTTTYSYDSNGNLVGVSAPENVSTSITRDSHGLPTSFTDPMGVITNFEYNNYGNLIRTTIPVLGSSSSATYDNASRVTGMTDALGRNQKFVYDNNDNLTSQTDPSNHATSYSYDSNDNLVRITNANGGVTTMTYDNATDWLTSVDFAGSTRRYAYNEDGSLGNYTKPDGTMFNYVYDELGRITYDGINSYNYDSNFQLSSISDEDNTLSYSYDGFNRVTGTSFNGQNNSYSYDKNGNRTSINETSYSYDNLNRMKTVTFSGKTITYTYRKDSQLSKVSYPNGMTTNYSYDAAGRLIGKNTKLSNGTVIAGYGFTLDNAGNIIGQTVQEPFSDVAMANENVNYTYNSGNRIIKAGDISFSFDENGNTTKRGSEAYSWDEQDRLTRAGTNTIQYDPLGMITAYGTTTFTTDPLGMGNVLSDSKSGAQYIYGNGLEARVINGSVSYYVTDVRGSVVAIVDGNGNITHKYQYDEFGKVIQKQEADYNPFQYVGKHGVIYLNDHLYYMRARFYDPTIGRFLSEDPVWSTNLYPYADNNPIMGIDPEGTSTLFGKFVDCVDQSIKSGSKLWDQTLDKVAEGIYKYGGDKAVDIMAKIANGTYVGTQQWKYLLDQSYNLMESGYVENNTWKKDIGSVLYLICSAWQEDTWLNTTQTVIAADNLVASVKKNGHNIMTDILGKTKGLGLVDMRTKLGRTIKAMYAIGEGGKTIYQNYNTFQNNLNSNNSWGNIKIVTSKWQ